MYSSCAVQQWSDQLGQTSVVRPNHKHCLLSSTLPTGPQGMHTTQDIRAVDHEGRVTDGGLQRDMVVEVSAPGVYEIDFERVTADRYHPIPPRRVNVRAGETTEVIVELRRK